MKQLKFLSLILTFALSASLLVSCDKDDDDDDEKKTTGSTVLTTETLSLYTKDYTIWHYFSFEKGEIIGTGSADPTSSDDSDWKARTDWDIAFHYKDLRTNSGKSGNGDGGMLEATSTVFDDVVEAPTSGYTVDDSLDIRLTAAMPPVYVKSTASSVCDDWAQYNHDEGAWIFAEKVFVVKTADGKYAKIWLKNFLDDEDNSGTITMDYMYQSDGSTKLN